MDTSGINVEGGTSGVGSLPRSIQPSGFLLALSGDWQVECASANVGAFLGQEAGELIGSYASTFLADEAIHALRNRLALLREPDGIERLFACPLGHDERPFDVAIHIAGEQVIVEAEPSTTKHYGDVTGTLRGMMARLAQPDDLSGFCTGGARQMRALTGFDRVIITRLEGDGSGMVIAEAARASGQKLAGARVPATAIAAYELAAYRRTPLHVIADAEAEPVAIIGEASDGAHVPDLGRAVLRSPSTGQLDHLRSMGARSSVTIALEVDDALWGLISCHHNSPRRVGFERRALAELFARMFAMQIEIAELKSALSLGSALRA